MNKITSENGVNTRFKSLTRAPNFPSHQGWLILLSVNSFRRLEEF